MTDWKPIVTLTSDVTEFIALLPNGDVRTAHRALGTILLGAYGNSATPSTWPTHWMPLPEPPTPNAPELEEDEDGDG